MGQVVHFRSVLALYTLLPPLGETGVVPLLEQPPKRDWGCASIGAPLVTAHCPTSRPHRESTSSQAAGWSQDLQEGEPFLSWRIAEVPLILHPGKASSDGQVLGTTRYNLV